MALATVAIHSPFPPGQRLAELITAHNVDYMDARMDQGNAACHVNALDPALNADVLRMGNLLVITAPDAPTWAGPLVTMPHRLSSGEYELSAPGVGSILANRTLPQDLHPIGKASGLVIRDMLVGVNLRSATGIYPPSVMQAGPRLEDFPLGGQSLLDGLNAIHQETDWEWHIGIEADPTHLLATLEWEERQGEDLSESVHLWNGVHFVEAEYKRDYSQLKEAQTVIIDFGARLEERQSVTRTLTPAPGRRDIQSGIFEASSDLIYDSIQAFPPALRNERVLIDVMAQNGSQASRRAAREQNRHADATEQIQIIANTIADWRHFRVGNILTLHLAIGRQDLTKKARVVTTHFDGERGECVMAMEAVA